jgi:hypothetical protein
MGIPEYGTKHSGRGKSGRESNGGRLRHKGEKKSEREHSFEKKR